MQFNLAFALSQDSCYEICTPFLNPSLIRLSIKRYTIKVQSTMQKQREWISVSLNVHL